VTLADDILAELRVPDLPYPVGDSAAHGASSWGGLLGGKWREQADEPVIEVLKSRNDDWSMRQVNAAYLADRTMDVFLLKSGLHPVLARRIARLRFWLAWRLEAAGAEVLSEDSAVRRWLDSLADLRGWSDSGGRSDRRVLERLDEFNQVIIETFREGDVGPLNDFVRAWCEDNAAQQARISRLRERLLATEMGAARQRSAEQQVRATIGRALEGRRLAKAVVEFVNDHWQGLMRQILLEQGAGSELWRQASRLFEWMVWAADPLLSDNDRDRLYRVGEQLTDKVHAVWIEATGGGPPTGATDGIQNLLVARLRDEPVSMTDARPAAFDRRWLDLNTEATLSEDQIGQWYVEGEGANEQRRFLLALLPDAGEVLWTNGAGVKLATERVEGVADKLLGGALRLLPPLNPFATVLADTVSGLAKVLEAQRRQRAQAVEKARAQAQAVREARERARLEAEEARRREEVAAAQRLEREKKARREAAAAERERAEALAAQEAERAREKLLAAARDQVDELRLGGWVELLEENEKLRMKLAVRINASGKLILVDRLGLNRREIGRQLLIERLLDGTARVLSGGAEFDEALSRVVGRIRVGRKP